MNSPKSGPRLVTRSSLILALLLPLLLLPAASRAEIGTAALVPDLSHMPEPALRGFIEARLEHHAVAFEAALDMLEAELGITDHDSFKASLPGTYAAVADDIFEMTGFDIEHFLTDIDGYATESFLSNKLTGGIGGTGASDACALAVGGHPVIDEIKELLKSPKGRVGGAVSLFYFLHSRADTRIEARLQHELEEDFGYTEAEADYFAEVLSDKYWEGAASFTPGFIRTDATEVSHKPFNQLLNAIEAFNEYEDRLEQYRKCKAAQEEEEEENPNRGVPDCPDPQDPDEWDNVEGLPEFNEAREDVGYGGGITVWTPPPPPIGGPSPIPLPPVNVPGPEGPPGGEGGPCDRPGGGPDVPGSEPLCYLDDTNIVIPCFPWF